MSFWKCPKCEHEVQGHGLPWPTPDYEGQWFGSLTEVDGAVKIECGECKALFDSISISATDIQKYQAKRDRAKRNMKLALKKAEELKKIGKQIEGDIELEDTMKQLGMDIDITPSADFSELKSLGEFEAPPEDD